eukprot:CAMPEP_0113458142 /NCGR_PEP_ID=MMETSP0014_2-20120614/9768_1 /TAXON_ID=2857 /ORGANISM="Nitzschia sp." /LENGTH=355 /DNA_ID=CAMNT_0000349653 /DNA_START=118 /DNA_END=1185 /DNA_ORIENTATION=- /assembly_acc=CAM_ASM_000159
MAIIIIIIATSTTTTSMAVSGFQALVVQNKGGGHGELGFQLAKTLATNEKIDKITILQDDACDESKEPFCSYATDLPSDKVSVIKASLGDESVTAEQLQSLLGDGATFDYVWDNNSKGPVGAGKAICDCCKNWNVKLYTYVSSAGMYQPNDQTTFPMDEATTPIKESSGQATQDAYALDLKLPLVSMRPQYIYGPKASKYDYIDWYFDRLTRSKPIPIPGDGTQKVSLTNSEDVSQILASPLNNEDAAVQQTYFNCGTDTLVSYDDVAYLCAAAAGIPKESVNIVHYDSSKGKGTFPFRLTNFYVAPDMVKSKLGWGGASTTLEGDLKWYYEGYVSRGGPTKDIDFSKDTELLSS